MALEARFRQHQKLGECDKHNIANQDGYNSDRWVSEVVTILTRIRDMIGLNLGRNYPAYRLPDFTQSL
jgi:hypothetical protein